MCIWTWYDEAMAKVDTPKRPKKRTHFSLKASSGQVIMPAAEKPSSFSEKVVIRRAKTGRIASKVVAAKPVNLRIPVETRSLIDQAAGALNKTRSEFMIEAARKAAEETLLDRTFVQVDADTYAAFLDVLDRPASGKGYERLMSAPTPWRD